MNSVEFLQIDFVTLTSRRFFGKILFSIIILMGAVDKELRFETNF